MLGWALGIPFLRNPIPNVASVRANTSVAFILAGMALLLPADRWQSWRRAPQVCALIVLLIGLAALLEQLLGIDRLPFAAHS